MVNKELFEEAQAHAREALKNNDPHVWVMAGEVLKCAYGLRGEIGAAEMEAIKDGCYTGP